MQIQNRIQSLRDSIGVEYAKPTMEKLEKMITDLKESEIAQQYLLVERGLTDETIKHFKLGYDKERNAIAIPVFKKGELINIKYRFIEPNKVKYTQEKNAEVWLFNDEGIQQGLEKKAILIVEGEFDLMATWQSGFKSVVSVASGKDSYGVWLELLDPIPMVFIAYDNDKAGQGASIKFAERIGTEKCFEIQYPEGVKDANEFFKTHTKEDFIELKNNARPFYKYQFKGLGDIIKNLREDDTEYLKTKFIPDVEFGKDWITVVSGRSNAGKCHAKGTSILMADGKIKNVEDIKIGDFVMGEDSKPKEVLNLGKGIDTLYRIWERGEYYDVNSEHILSLWKNVWDKKEKRSYKRYEEISVKDFIKFTKAKQNKYQGWKVGIEFQEKRVSLEPYILGLWLGDGTSSKPDLTTADVEIENIWKEFALKNNLSVNEYCQTNNKSKTLALSCGLQNGQNYFLNRLQEYNLINKKHIPHEYKTNSEKVRLELLAGLIDTDGNLSKSSYGECYEITQKSNDLANDIVYLARSLGFRVKISKSVKSIKEINFKGEYNRIHIFGDLSRIPVILNRKRTEFKSKKDYLKSKIKIEELNTGEYYGFTLTGNGLYVLGNFTVTHNTSYLMNIAGDFAKNDTPVLIMPFERGVDSVGQRFLQANFDKTRDDFKMMDDSEWDKVIKESIELPIYFSVPKREEIVDTIVKSKRIFNTKIVVIDHLDYVVRHVNGNREAEIANTLQNLKRVAEEHSILILIVTHIRKIDTVGAEVLRKPNIEDLKGSASLYQDPECVIMIYQGEEEDTLKVDVLKNKGKMSTKEFKFNQATGKLTESNFDSW
jgi:DNA primase